MNMKLGLKLGLSALRSIGAVPGLLDEFSGAAAAYSLRYLTNNYTGDVIIVRRGSDNAEEGFTPTEITNGTLEAFCGVGDGFIKTWYDQSSNARSATQATTSAQPKIVSIGSLIVNNGKPAIDFNGTSQFLSASTFGISGTIDRSFFVLAESRSLVSGSNGRTYIGIGDGSGSPNDQAWELNHEHSVRILGGNEVYGTGVINTQYLTVNICNGLNVTDNRLWVNGSEENATGSGSSTYSTLNSVNYIGNSTYNPLNSFFDGLIQEIIIYADDQSANRTAIETAINSYYSIY